MKKYGLLSEIRRRSKWVTDISYLHTKEGVLYLSMIGGQRKLIFLAAAKIMDQHR